MQNASNNYIYKINKIAFNLLRLLYTGENKYDKKYKLKISKRS